ncbi:probable G-protein coupled receptor 19 [Mya arenaria]|uniref:probable G-protein coupled receptor 19 n=1 Tax=Mya arenaria TaxID=6604 RepID=UPI0022E906E1|nr:probable G-protein coupled receptor 19 [Mya arenaria]
MTSSFNSTVSFMVTGDLHGKTYEETGLEAGQPLYQIAIQCTLLMAIWLCSISANLLVCLVIYRSRRIQSTTNYFVVSMALSDLLFTIFCVPFIASRLISNRWLLGPIMCRLVRFVQISAPTTSVFVLASISVDRFYTIIYPLSFKITRGTAKRLIVSCWTLSFAVCIFSIYFFQPLTITWGHMTVCPTYVPNKDWMAILYGALFVSLTYLIPVIIIIVIYSRIFRYVWTPSTDRRSLKRTSNSVPRTKVKMLKMLIIVTVVTLSCHTPYYIVQLWYSISSVVYVNPSIFVASFLLIFLTTTLKPLLYMMYNSNFRRGCREVFCMSNMKCYRSHTYAITNASQVSKKNHVGIMPAENGRGGIHSPTLVFNRTPILDKMAWPMDANSLSTTYL